jgi:hypothetical protein
VATEIEQTRDRLLRSLARERPALEKNDLYFEGEQPLRFIAPALEQQLGYRLSPIVINLARYITDVYDTRTDITGFRFAGAESSDEELWSIFEHNDGPFQAQQANREALALSRSYAIVGEGVDDIPLLTVESPFEAIHEDDPRTHEVKNGVKVWTELDKTKFVSLYHPNGRQTWYRKSGSWVEDSSEENDFNLCRMVPLINEPRVLGRYTRGKFDQRLGRSVFHDVIPIMDALNKIASDMMVSAEFHALPRRWATGLAADDFVDESTGEPMDTFSMIAGRMWGTEAKEAKFGQFAEAELTNFHQTIKLLMQVAGTLVALPPHYTTFTGDNPTSADAIRSAESPLVKRVERKNAGFASEWERVQRLTLLTLGYPDSPEARQIETQYAEAATPTVAQKADAIVKLVTATDGKGRSIVPVQQAREDLGYTAQVQSRMADWDAENAVDPQVLAANRGLAEIANSGSGE